MGLSIGTGVVVVGSVRYGFSFPLLVLGIVCAVAFGGFAFVSLFARRRAEFD